LGAQSVLREAEWPQRERFGSAVLGASSLLVASTEAICTFFVVVSKLGILVAVTSFLSSVIVSRYHTDGIRVPVLAIAFAGAVLNLGILWNQHRLRRASSAAWRKRALSRRAKQRIALLLASSAITLLMVTVEFVIHPLRVI
jgi:hypothetical protein